MDGWINIEPTIRAWVGHEVVIGHDGDLRSGGDRTLFWASEEDSEDDDGARALGEVRRAGQEDE